MLSDNEPKIVVPKKASSAGFLVDTLLVVPCFNEAIRWNLSYWSAVSSIPHLIIMFVDDGSTDQTKSIILDFVAFSGDGAVTLEVNGGKSEAIRVGLELGMTFGPNYVGYLDADSAFPLEEVRRLVLMNRSHPRENFNSSRSIWSSRVKLAGRKIERRTSRHYLARVVVTILAFRHKFVIYDPQSGFKIFESCDELKSCLRQPFKTRWFVDLEILLRWRAVAGAGLDVWEEPVAGWQDVADSKLSGAQLLVVSKEILTLIFGSYIKNCTERST